MYTFTNKIFEYIDYKGCSILDGIKEFINFSALYGVDILKENIHISEDSVKLMTLHACKGLEFKYVFIIGVNYGLIPLLKDDIEELDEEKRLFFVGITRAIDNLEISYYTSPGSPRVISGPSNFLSMLPKHLINISDRNEAKSDLKAFRREIKNNIEKGVKNEKINTETLSKVRHERYGIGAVESEDDNTIVVLFDGYGRKEFDKAFNALEFL